MFQAKYNEDMNIREIRGLVWLYAGLILAVVLGMLLYFFVFTEKSAEENGATDIETVSPQELLRRTTATETPSAPPAEVIRQLDASGPAQPVSEDILKSLTAPTNP